MMKEFPTWETVDALRKDLDFNKTKMREIEEAIIAESVKNARAFYEVCFNNRPLTSMGEVVKFLAFCSRLEIRWADGTSPLESRTINVIDRHINTFNTSIMIHVYDNGAIAFEVIKEEEI